MYRLLFQVYVCEDCGHSTSDPEFHFRHLQQNHPYCPALQRCHDKRQFKFKSENGEASSESKDEQSTYNNIQRLPNAKTTLSSDNTVVGYRNEFERQADETVSAVRHIQHSVNKSDDRLHNLEKDDFERKQSIDSRLQPVTEIMKRNDSIINRQNVELMDTNFQTAYYRDVSNDRILQNANQGVSDANKRLLNSDPPNVSPKKKLKTSSPKKNRPNSSPIKVRPSVCENGGIIPRFDAENVISKKSDENGVKKRPLGSLTQNTLNQQKNLLNIHSNHSGVIGKRPLGNILGSSQSFW